MSWLSRSRPATENRYAVNAVEWSADGRWLALTGTDADKVSVWDTQKWTIARQFRAGRPITVAISPDGRLVAFNSGSAVAVHDITTGNLVAMHDARTDKVQKVAFTPDGRQLCCGGSDRLIEIWTLPAHEELVIPAHPSPGAARRNPHARRSYAGPVQDLAISPDGRCLASAGYNGAVGLWEIYPKGTVDPMFSFAIPFVQHPVAVAHDLTRLVALKPDENLQIWDVRQSRLLETRVIPHVPNRQVFFAGRRALRCPARSAR